MKRIFWFLLSLLFPWAVQLVDDNPGAAFVSLVMQVTIIGWPFASLWAWGVAKPYLKSSKKKKLE